MATKPLPLIRSSQLLPFIEYLQATGVAGPDLLQKCFCPVNADLSDPDCIIPTNRLWQFIEESARKLGDRDLGWKVAMKCGVYGAGEFGFRLENQNSLADAIYLYSSGLSQHASVSKGKLQEEGTSTWFYRGTIPPKGTTYAQVEQYAIGTMVHIARCYLGSQWQPRRIKLTSNLRQARVLQIAESCSELILDADRAGIEIPQEALSQGRKPIPNSLENRGIAAPPFPGDLPAILVQMLAYYIPHYELTLSQVSTIIEMHPRTLDRRLAEYGMSFRDIRNQVYSAWAKKALSGDSLSIAAISEALGYANQSAFSRAFSRLTGNSPLKYRQRTLKR